MGVGTSKEEDARLAKAVHKLSSVELKNLETVFQELSFTDDQGKRLIKRPTWLDRENFASKLGLPDFLGEQLFAAFDRDQNEVVDLNEFLAGMALCLHGTVKDKCRLLFKIFNLDGDEGITRDELTTVLISALQSAQGVLISNSETGKGTIGWEMKINETVDRMVRDAFEKCDTSRNGRLELEEFEHWVHTNSKLINSMFLISCPTPEDESSQFTMISVPPHEFQLKQDDKQKDREKTSLSELFGNKPSTIKDIDGQSFFDSMNSTENIASFSSVSQSAQTSFQSGTPILTQEADGTTPSKLNAAEDINLQSEVPAMPELSTEILQQHHILINEERLVSRTSEMSLVSLGQSTGDLSTLDADQNNQTEVVKGVENDSEVMDSHGNKKGPGQLAQGIEDAVKPGAENMDDDVTAQEGQNVSNLGLDLSRNADQLLEKTDITSPWHPLKHPFKSTLNNESDDDSEDNPFQDASDVLQSSTNLGLDNTGLENAIREISLDDTAELESRVEVALNAELDSETNSGKSPTKDIMTVSLESGANPKVDSETISTFNVIPRHAEDPKIKSDVQSNGDLEEIEEAKIGDIAVVSERPPSLDVQFHDAMTHIDLSPGEHPIRKPTLRQLAEIKEFDKSPSLEDAKGALPEARFAAWLPSLETRQLLDDVNRGNAIEQSHLTYPSVLLETSLGDPVRDLVTKFLSEQEAEKRPVPTADSVTMNDAGLRNLLGSQCWRAAVDWTAKYLTAHGQGVSSGSPTGPFNHTPKLLQIWFVRIALLFKLKSFSSAEAELNAFGDFENPDLYYEYYPDIYPGMKGCLVPFSLRIIHAELPQHNGRPQETLDRLYRLLSVVRTISTNLEGGFSEEGDKIELGEKPKETLSGSLQFWKTREVRLLYCLGNCLIGIKEYHLAMQILTEIIRKKPETKSGILSGVGRLHLQLGDIPLAKKYFKKVEQISLGDPKTLSVTVMNRGFAALAEGKYDEAYENFQSVTKLDPDNSSAWNDAAVCLLFQGKVKEACNLLETLIWKSPKRNLDEDIIFNLCTIYELETSRAFQKKQKLLDLVSRQRGDGFNVQSLKLS